MATPGSGMIDEPLAGKDSAEGRGGMDEGTDEGRIGMDGAIGEGAGAALAGTTGAVFTSVMWEFVRRAANFQSPHQSSSRTCGQTPSIMYAFALIGLSMGEPRRHCPHCVTVPSLGLTFCLS